MEIFQKSNSSKKTTVLTILGVVFSSICWYFSNGLTGDFWFLLWIAPIPILMISLRTSAKKAFIISFIAYLIGRLSWFSYLVTVATIVPAVIFTILLPLIFALIIVLTRWIILKSNSWISVFAFPLIFTLFEFPLINFSPDGTAASIAYSQSNVLPVIQIASITGILGITFLVTLIPSAITLCWHFYEVKPKFYSIIGATSIILVSTITFGLFRLSNHSKEETIKAGLIVLDEKNHNMSPHPDFQKENQVIGYYVNEIIALAKKGAEIIVLPERAVNIDKTTAEEVNSLLSNTAIQYQVSLVIGYTNFKNEPQRNSALTINPNGEIVGDYNKVHLVTGLENQFTPGSETGLFNLKGVQSGTAICKDLDFPTFIRNYGNSDVNILAIPAWDFEVDAWLHSRMAILRGVENGFSEIRTARQGLLTISDYYGRVTYEADCSKGAKASLIGEISVKRIGTVYSRVGDLFGFIVLILSVSLITMTWFRIKSS